MAEGIDWLNSLSIINKKRILCLVDGEHHPPVTEWALNSIKRKGGKISGLVFTGGTEKIKGNNSDSIFSISCPYYASEKNKSSTTLASLVHQAVEEVSPDLVIDLSDMPILDSQTRFKIASILLAHEITYAGADFIFTPPANSNILTKPSITIQGTGKRVGKTAVSITLARILKRHDISPAVVAMGRGGPSEPQVVFPNKIKITPEYLLDFAAKGHHAASDYWENAVLSNTTTIGCRRCGGGFAGNPFISNVSEGVNIANNLPEDLIIMEGSGPTTPPVKTGGKILVTGAHQKIEDLNTYFGDYRLITADLVIVTMCEPPNANQEKIKAIEVIIKQINPDVEVVFTVFRPEPFGDLKNKKIFLATTSPAKVIKTQSAWLEENYNCTVTGVSTHLSNRELLKNDLKQLKSADILLTEIKAASIDMAAKAAMDYKKKIVFLHNQLVLKENNTKNLDDIMLDLCKKLTLH